jgi:hypothetical protein
MNPPKTMRRMVQGYLCTFIWFHGTWMLIHQEWVE